jgi:glycosyltransferase involved in cell wall biosynthesis
MAQATFLIDLSHTSHTQARTGIQRVSRALLANIEGAKPITFDPYQDTWRLLERWETATLTAQAPAASRGARWPFAARLRGRMRSFVSAKPSVGPADVLIVPELFSPAVARSLPSLFSQISGGRVALFHDAIALQMPAAAPAKTVTRFPSYLKELLQFDGIAAISGASKDSLLGYWKWLGVSNHPPVEAIPLGTDRPSARGTTAPRSGPPEILFVSSIEARKNHVALLNACDILWEKGLVFSLRLIGLAHPVSGKAALETIDRLKAKGRPIRYDGAVSETILESAYAECAFTAYPSLVEGFGLPVIESVVRGRPCVCLGTGAIGEAAKGGGCLTLAHLDETSLAAAIEKLLADPTYLERLAQEASMRTAKDWATYAREVAGWSKSLRRKA